MANIRIKGLDALRSKWSSAASIIQPALKSGMHEAVLYVHSQVPPYPAPPIGSTYIRTGQLGRSITERVEELSQGVAGYIGTNTIYAPWVISSEAVGGRGPQARVHQGRWWTLQGVVERSAANVQKIFERVVDDILKRL